jgi:8-oxo-dGTP diphosphatase
MSQPGYWEFPGGKIEQGENPKAALVREIREELLCDIQVGEHIKEVVYDYPNLRVRLVTYYARLISGIPIATEHERLKWVSCDDIENLRWAPADIPTVNILSEKEKSAFRSVDDSEMG